MVSDDFNSSKGFKASFGKFTTLEQIEDELRTKQYRVNELNREKQQLEQEINHLLFEEFVPLSRYLFEEDKEGQHKKVIKEIRAGKLRGIKGTYQWFVHKEECQWII